MYDNVCQAVHAVPFNVLNVVCIDGESRSLVKPKLALYVTQYLMKYNVCYVMPNMSLTYQMEC